MEKTNILLTIVLIVLGFSLQKSYAQINPCPVNYKKAEKVLKEYLSKGKNIKSLHYQYDMSVSKDIKKNLKSLSGDKDKEECQQLISNLKWLEKVPNYSIYKVAKHYFIVIYSFDKNGRFQMKEIPIVNSQFEAIGSIIDFDNPK